METSIVSVAEDFQSFIVNSGDIHDGVQVIFRFPNNYGASVVKHQFSYGVELSVVKFKSENSDDWHICYDTPITNDVIGHLDAESLYSLLMEIKSL